jgi:hypothetical protein
MEQMAVASTGKLVQCLTITCLLQAVVVVMQGALAGQFLSGVDRAVRFHELGGWLAFALATVQVLLTFGLPNRLANLTFIVMSAVVAVCEILQLGTGYGRYLQVHLPLALVIVGVLTWQVLWITAHRRKIDSSTANAN